MFTTGKVFSIRSKPCQLILLFLLVCVGCDLRNETSTPTATRVNSTSTTTTNTFTLPPTVTITSSVTATVTEAPTSTPSSIPTLTPTVPPTATSTPTETPSPIVSPAPSPILPTMTREPLCVGASSAEFTVQAWLALREGNHEIALTCTEATIERWTAEADVQQAQREQEAICSVTPDPADQAAVDTYWAMSWAINDVAASWFIRGEVLWQLGEVEPARQAYQTVVERYFCGWAWDPQGWFWHIAHAARERLEQLPD